VLFRSPDFDRVMASAKNSYELKLPEEKMARFNTGKYQILNDSVKLLLSDNYHPTRETAVQDANKKMLK
jgi:hypothetical protein